MALPASTYVPLTADPVATVAALNAAVANLVAESDDYIAVPLYQDDGIMVTGSPVTDAGYFAGLAYDSVPTGTLVDPVAMDAYIATLPPEQGIREVVPTKFGYDLVVLGVAPEAGAPPPVLEFNYADPGLTSQDTLVTISTPDQNGITDNFIAAALLAPFPASADYVRSTIYIAVTASQASGFNVGQTIGYGVRLFNDTNPSSVTNNLLVAGAQKVILEAGQTSQLLFAGHVDVTTSEGDGVRVLAAAGLGIAIGALESDFILTVAAFPAAFGERLQ